MDTPFFDAEATAKLDAAASACDALTSRLDAMERADAEDRIEARVRGDDWSPEAREAAAKARAKKEGGKDWGKIGGDEPKKGASKSQRDPGLNKQREWGKIGDRADNYIAPIELPSTI